MCGIAGIFHGRGVCRDAAHEWAVVERMTTLLAHRGPDASGIWQDAMGRCTLGHRRLSIIDLTEAGAQPMYRESTPWVLSFNGEIYNASELRSELEALGRRFRGHADTEVLLQAIDVWGLAALPRLDGMFAFAAFNQQTGEMILARDPFGEKPLYYSDAGSGGIAFASELTAIESLPWFRRVVPRERMAEMLMFQYVGAPRTIYRDASKLPPGHFMHVSSNGSRRVERYFAYEPAEPVGDTRTLWEAADELEAILTTSLRRRLMSDVPLGALLSGGVDSATTCALIRRVLDVPLQTFSLGFKGADESETEVAAAFATAIGSEHQELIVDESAVDFLARIGELQDEPNGDVSCFPTYFLSQLVREHVTVAVSGDGGDEMFGGYGRYFQTLAEVSDRPFGPFGREYYSRRILVMSELEIRALFGDLDPVLRGHLELLRHQLDDRRDEALAAMRMSDAANYLPGAVLAKVDRMSMQHSLEVRTPFLSPDVATFAAGLPHRLLVDGSNGKMVLRELAYRYLPHDLIDLPKKGFGLPSQAWGAGAIWHLAEERLGGRHSRLRSALGPQAIHHFLSRPYRLEPLWAMLTLESWLRAHDAEIEPATTSISHPRSARWLSDKTLLLVDDDFLDAEAFSEVDGATSLGAGVTERTLSLLRTLRPLVEDEGLPSDPEWVRLPASVPVDEGLRGQGVELAGARVVWFRGDAFVVHGRPRFALRLARSEKSLTVGLASWHAAHGLVKSAAAEVGPASAVLVVNPLDDSTDLPIVWHHRRLDRRRLRAARSRVAESRPSPQPMLMSTAEQLASQIKNAPRSPGRRPLRSAVVLTHALPSGGAERQWCYLATGLADAGTRVTFVTTHRISGANAHYAPLLRDPRLRVQELPDLGAPDLLGYVALHDLRSPLQRSATDIGDRVLQLACVLRRDAPDAVFAQLDEPNVIGAAAGLSAGTPSVVCSFRNYSPRHFAYLDSDFYRPAYGALREREEVILSGNSTPGNADYAEWLGAGRESITLIPNGVATNAVDLRSGVARARAEVRADLGVAPEAPIIIGAFRLSHEKRPELFLEACARVAARVPGLCVLLAGVGPLEDHLRRLASRYGFDRANFQFLGLRSDLGSLMAASDVLLLTSRFEGTPNVVLEAQLLGIPVVAPPVGGVADVVADGVTGILVAEPVTPSALAAALEAVLENSAQWHERVERGRAALAERYSIAAMVEAHRALIPSD